MPAPNIPRRLSVQVLLKLLGWLIAAGASLCRLILLTWGALAIYWFEPTIGAWLRVVLATAFVAFGVLCLRRGTPKAFGGFALVFLVLLACWAAVRPSNDREWRPEVRVMPRAVIEGDHVTLLGVRNFSYHSRHEFEERYETRQVDLAHLQAVDFFISQWSDLPIGHTFVSFIFDNAKPVCVSIEARLEKNETYSPLASCFKQAELIYVVGDEADIVGVRANHRNERLLLYRTVAGPEAARRVFLSYLDKINRLAVEPEFYHLLSNNCTVNIDRHAQRDGRRGAFDLRVLLNGNIDALMYLRGLVDTSLPFDQLKKSASITDLAKEADNEPDYSAHIRARLRVLTSK